MKRYSKNESNIIQNQYMSAVCCKRKKVMIIFILLFFIIIFESIIPKNITLAETNIGVSVDKENVEKGQNIKVTVDTENPNISAFTLEIYFDMTKLEYVNETKNGNFSSNRVIYTWVDENLQERAVAKTETFTFKALQDGIANIVVTGEFYDKEGKRIYLQDGTTQVTIGNQVNVITKNIDNGENQEQVSSDNTNLKIMRLNHEGISPEFQKGIKEYYFIADNSISSLQVTAIPENSKSQVTVTGNTNLKQGLNTIKIEVQSEDKTKKVEYKIYVTKTKNKELANANLENLAVREAMLYPAFDANITQYDIEVANDIDRVDVLAVPEKIGASVTISGNEKLEVGDNIITINVAAEDEITNKKYVIKAHRRSEQEEIQAKEEQQEQAKQLEAILENQTEENNDKQDFENKPEMSVQDMITFVLLGMIVVGFIVGFIIHKWNERK